MYACMYIYIYDIATKSNETCIFGNKTVIRGQRIENGCSKVCICKDDGYLMCKSKCPSNKTIGNQHDRCVVLTDPGYDF